MTAPICRVPEAIPARSQGTPDRRTATVAAKGSADAALSREPSEWLRNVLEHCDRATSTSLATMRALGKDSTKIRKAVGK